MSHPDDTRLHRLLAIDRADATGALQERVALKVGGVAEAGAAMAARLAEIDPAALRGELRKMLDVDLLGLLASAWNQLRELKEAVERSRADPSKPETVKLSSHALDGTLKPRLVLVVGGIDWCQIDFQVKVSATLQAANLVLIDGALVALDLAGLEGAISLAVEGFELADYKRPLPALTKLALAQPLALT